MNAPEKIYLFKNPITEELDDRWLSNRSCDDDIEYVFADAFIEKAKEFLSKESNIPLWEGYNDTFGCDTRKLVENFINYMKEE